MKDQSLTISVQTASELIALGLVGVMTKETYTELMVLLGSARIIDRSILPDGSANSSQNVLMQGHDLEQLFTSAVESQTQETSTQPSP